MGTITNAEYARKREVIRKARGNQMDERIYCMDCKYIYFADKYRCTLKYIHKGKYDSLCSHPNAKLWKGKSKVEGGIAFHPRNKGNCKDFEAKSKIKPKPSLYEQTVGTIETYFIIIFFYFFLVFRN